jgi:hypothetical protein
LICFGRTHPQKSSCARETPCVIQASAPDYSTRKIVEESKQEQQFSHKFLSQTATFLFQTATFLSETATFLFEVGKFLTSNRNFLLQTATFGVGGSFAVKK